MSGQEICIIVIPNDFPDESDRNETTSPHIETINEAVKPKHRKQQAVSNVEENTATTTRHRPSQTTSAQNHTKEYPCPQCEKSLCNRFRYHTIPKLKLRDTVWIPTNNNKNFFIVCYTELGPQSDGIIDELRRAEIGIHKDSKVFIVPLNCALGIQKVVEKQKTLSDAAGGPVDMGNTPNGEFSLPMATPLPTVHGPMHLFLKSIRARLTVQKVIGSIEQQSSLTFDYLFFCVLASFIATLGLLDNNTVVLVASMLVSPLMGPIMGFVIGMRIRSKKLWLSGLNSEIIGIAVSILTGFLFGLCTTWSETRWGSSESFPTDQMRQRGDYRRLWFGALLAIPSGAAAVLSILGGNFGSLVGVALSASLLPPAVNTGLLFSYSLLAATHSSIGRHSTQILNGSATYNSLPTLANCTAFIDNDYLPLYSCNMPTEAALLGVYSCVITLINIVCICVMALSVLLIKKVSPIVPDEDMTNIWKKTMSNIRQGSDNEIQSGLDNGNVHELTQIWKTIDEANGLPHLRKEHDV